MTACWVYYMPLGLEQLQANVFEVGSQVRSSSRNQYRKALTADTKHAESRDEPSGADHQPGLGPTECHAAYRARG